MEKIKITLADDHTLTRQTLAKSLNSEPKFVVIGEAENGRILLDLIGREEPDIILLDIDMPVMDGFEVLEHLQKRECKAKVIVLSMHFDNLIVADLINQEVRGLLPKNTDFESLLSAIHEVMASGYYFSKKVSLHLVQDLIVRQKIRPMFSSPKLTYQETQLLELICQDRQLKEIAEVMAVSPRTLERYKTGLYEKTRAKTMVGLVLFAIKYNYFSPQRQLQN